MMDFRNIYQIRIRTITTQFEEHKMLVALMSDSHDNLNALARAVSFCNQEKVGAVLHAGDLVAPFVSRELNKLDAPLTIVFGNNDGEKQGLREAFKDKIFDPPHELELDGKRIVMLHAPLNLQSYIDSKQHDLILYGHLHRIEVTPGPPIVVNPGELGAWLTGKSTMALWDTKANLIEVVTL
jgi:uncharacterized protein